MKQSKVLLKGKKSCWRIGIDILLLETKMSLEAVFTQTLEGTIVPFGNAARSALIPSKPALSLSRVDLALKEKL
jgi:hypothetical protein